MRSSYILYITIAALLVFSCSEEGPSLKGDLIIFMQAYNIQGEKLGDVSNIEVSILETGQTLTTNEYGRVVFENIETAEYQMNISHPDIGEVQKPLSFLGGGVPDIKNLSLFESPKIDSIFLAEIDTSFLSNHNYPNLYFRLRSKSPFNAVAFISETDKVDKDHYLLSVTNTTPVYHQSISLYEVGVNIRTSLLRSFTNEQNGYLRFYVTNIANRYHDPNPVPYYPDLDALFEWGEVMTIKLDY